LKNARIWVSKNREKKRWKDMEQAREILRRYAQADFFNRIYLFLQFPGLRDVFQEIERIIVRRSKGFPTFDCTAEQREMPCATIVSRSDQRDIEIEKNRNGLLGLKRALNGVPGRL
jgi:hypothetical protein